MNRGGQRGWRGKWRGGWRGRGNWRGNFNNNQSRGASGSASQIAPSPNPERLTQTSLLDVPSPFTAWKLYFPDQMYSDSSDLVQKIKLFQSFFCSTLWDFNNIETNGWFLVDFQQLSSDQDIRTKLNSLAEELRSSPEPVIKALSLAMHQILCEEGAKKLKGETDDETSLHELISSYPLGLIYCRLLNFGPVTQLKNLKANYYGKFVTVKGTVVRVSNIKPMCLQMAFTCCACTQLQVEKFPDGKFNTPSQCITSQCRSKQFTPMRSHQQTETVDWQTIRIQEDMNDNLRESGRIPRTIDCELMCDLVDSCVPGDSVTTSGIVKVLSVNNEGGRNKQDKCVFHLYIQANSISNTKGGGGGNRHRTGDVKGGVSMDFSVKDLYAIEEIQAQPDLLRLLVASLCPAIYGHEVVKAGLLLALFGGTHKNTGERQRIPVRGDAHVLLVGDPGLGKSQMLQAVSAVAPRGVYVCGSTSTASGLTVTLTREGGGSDHALEAGALVLADQGCCCIDEFDKMGTQHQALLEAMEQQSISIAKAGIVCSLPARTAILAAANPVGGHYDSSKTVSENLCMGPALLSRFDLVFLLLDRADEERDAMLSAHVMAAHARRPNATPRGRDDSFLSTQDSVSRQEWERDRPLSERLQVARGEVLDLIPPQLLRKYVAYARKYVQPKITPECAKILQEFYLDLRRQQTKDGTPITTRQLESLIRLAEARARVELREECSAQDAQNVVALLQHSMRDTLSDPLLGGALDFSRSQHGSGMSSRGAARRMLAVLEKHSQMQRQTLYNVPELRQLASQARISVPDFSAFLAALNHQGFLLKKGPQLYQLQTAG